MSDILSPFSSWQEVLSAPRSAFFSGHTSDTQLDRSRAGDLLTPYSEALFTQSNARLLLGHAANGSLRFVALPTCVYPAPTQTGEFGLGPGMYHHFDVAMYAGDLFYQIRLAGSAELIDLANAERQNESWYADDFLPVTRAQEGSLAITLISLAPVAADARQAPLAPAPLPGPAGALYLMYLRNEGEEPLEGQVVLQAGDLLVGHYEDATPQLRSLKRPSVDLRQHTLILTRPEGSVGIHLHQGRWTKLEPPFQAERAFRLAPGEELMVETHLTMGQSHSEVMREIFGLHLRPALEWLNRTAAFWHERLGTLSVDAVQAHEEALVSRDIYIRSLLDNFNCLQTDAQGNLVAHWQGAPSHGYGTVWGIDVEPTAVSVVHICPEITWRTLLFFMERSQAPKGLPDHSIPILVAPVIIARQWLQVTGDVSAFERQAGVMPALESILQRLLSLESPTASLFPSRYSSDGVVGRRYDYGTNVKVWYAFDSLAYLSRQLDQPEKADFYGKKADAVRQAIQQTMVTEGPFGPQVSGGVNLEHDPGTFYLPEDVFYYDGEDTSSMLAPIYGMCDFSSEAWINYHRFARSLWHAGYDPEFDTLYWHPAEPAVLDGTAYFSRLGGCATSLEMKEAMQTLHELAIDDVTGSVFWWPHGVEFKRALTRCSQGQGAWAWQYLYQWLGLKVDARQHLLTVAPLGMLTRMDWPGFCAGPHRFSIHWEETQTGAQVMVRNHNDRPWRVQVGFRPLGAGATGLLTWQTVQLAPGEEATLAQHPPGTAVEGSLDRTALIRLEAQNLADADGIVFRRYGPALLWGHWDARFLWDWRAMPLALRFVIINATGVDWEGLSVDLTCPEGWLAQGRQPKHWIPPEAMDSGTVALELRNLANSSRTVAAFWFRPQPEFTLRIRWDDPNLPFHAPSQPGGGLLLRALDLDEEKESVFRAKLTATATNGKRFEKELLVPVRIVPYRG